MSIKSIPRLFFISAVLAALLLITSFAKAAPSALDAALNSSLEESKDIRKTLNDSFSNKKASHGSHKVSTRQRVEINLDEADAEKAVKYRETQANGDLKEGSY